MEKTCLLGVWRKERVAAGVTVSFKSFLVRRSHLDQTSTYLARIAALFFFPHHLFASNSVTASFLCRTDVQRLPEWPQSVKRFLLCSAHSSFKMVIGTHKAFSDLLCRKTKQQRKLVCLGSDDLQKTETRQSIHTAFSDWLVFWSTCNQKTWLTETRLPTSEQCVDVLCSRRTNRLGLRNRRQCILSLRPFIIHQSYQLFNGSLSHSDPCWIYQRFVCRSSDTTDHWSSSCRIIFGSKHAGDEPPFRCISFTLCGTLFSWYYHTSIWIHWIFH